MNIMLRFFVGMTVCLATAAAACGSWYCNPAVSVNVDCALNNGGGIATIAVTGMWPDGGTPHSPVVTVTGNRIDVVFQLEEGGGATITGYCETAVSPPLPDGVYELYLTLCDDPIPYPSFVVDTSGCVRACVPEPLRQPIGAGVIAAMTVWDPDGPGPLPEMLVVARNAVDAENGTVAEVAAWDGVQWHAIGGAVQSTSWWWTAITSVVVHNGQLVIGGRFQTAGGMLVNNVARWDGQQWQSIGAGIGGAATIVHALTVYQGDLIAAWGYSPAGATGGSHVLRWTGQQWEELGTGAPNQNTTVALAVHAGGLYAIRQGTSLSQIVRWDDGQWLPLAGELVGESTWLAPVLFSHAEMLYAATHITCAWAPCLHGQSLQRWNGVQWEVIAGNDVLGGRAVGAMAVHDGDLVAALTGACGRGGILRWNGVQWHSAAGADGPVGALAVYEGRLFTAGSFDQIGGVLSPRIASWDCPSCPADWNSDGRVDSYDVSAYVSTWLMSVTEGVLVADFNHDGRVNSTDIAAFITVWLAAANAGGC